MKRFALLLAFMCACDTSIRIQVYDTECQADTDCVVVQSDACLCPDAAIARTELERYQDDLNAKVGLCADEDRILCEEQRAACIQERCEALRVPDQRPPSE